MRLGCLSTRFPADPRVSSPPAGRLGLNLAGVAVALKQRKRERLAHSAWRPLLRAASGRPLSSSPLAGSWPAWHVDGYARVRTWFISVARDGESLDLLTDGRSANRYGASVAASRGTVGCCQALLQFVGAGSAGLPAELEQGEGTDWQNLSPAARASGVGPSRGSVGSPGGLSSGVGRRTAAEHFELLRLGLSRWSAGSFKDHPQQRRLLCRDRGWGRERLTWTLLVGLRSA